ncbi:MAG: helix-turn-helix transcriptional regulator [Bacteroidota bacterium]
MKGANLGEFEELLLLVVLILKEDAYVNQIREELKDQVNRSISMGALHTTLSRLEKKGFLQSEMAGATETRGGRRKRVYELTVAGKSALVTARDQRATLWEQIPAIDLKFFYG